MFGFRFLEMAKKKNMPIKAQSDKYIKQNKLAASRQQKYRDTMSEEKKEEYRKKARERYQKRKAENKVKLIKEMSAKQQRERRKKWKLDSKRYRDRKKINLTVENEPLQTEEEEGLQNDDKNVSSRQSSAGRKKVRRDKAKAYRELKEKDKKIQELERKVAKYKNNCKGNKKRFIHQQYLPRLQSKSEKQLEKIGFHHL